MKIQLTLHCDNNCGAHYAELASWDVSDVDDQIDAKDTLQDLLSDLRKLAAREGWLLIPAEHKGWTRVLCPKCCAGQGGGDG